MRKKRYINLKQSEKMAHISNVIQYFDVVGI